MRVTLEPLTAAPRDELIALMNHPAVRRHLPLARSPFDHDACEAFIEAKTRMWEKNGYGPSAIRIGQKFAGWGGPQPHEGEADLALVLHPAHWGLGRAIFQTLLAQAFDYYRLPAVTILLPTTRNLTRPLQRLGFTQQPQTQIDGIPFNRFRLTQRSTTAGGPSLKYVRLNIRHNGRT